MTTGQKLTIRKFEILTEKVKRRVRLALITDLHSCFYGEGQRELLAPLKRLRPDFLLYGGDIVDDRLPLKHAAALLKAAEGRWPALYVTGNHEYYTKAVGRIKRMFRAHGVTVLEGACKTVSAGGQELNICGVDDASVGAREFAGQLRRAAGGRRGLYTVLLSHRPEQIASYLEHDFDLILSGHAHGGQWRLPGVVNGLYAPDQGLFPQYAGGLYRFGEKTFVVSRGLARESTPLIPRIFNPPELVVIDLTPAPGARG